MAAKDVVAVVFYVPPEVKRRLEQEAEEAGDSGISALGRRILVARDREKHPAAYKKKKA